MIWSAPSFKALFAPKGKLSALVANFDLPGTFSNISHKPITLSLNLIGQTGTAILITIIITVLMAKKLTLVMLVVYLLKHLKIMVTNHNNLFHLSNFKNHNIWWFK